MLDILAVDVGTTTFKLGVFDAGLGPKAEVVRRYDIQVEDRAKAQIDPELWWQALRDCCAELRRYLPNVRVISLSVTTPGLVAMDRAGKALHPAILFMDGRSTEQAGQIRKCLGDRYFLEEACNLPVSGGSSLASILWIRDELPRVWNATVKFGHCNTYMVKRLTGKWGIDPSTTSITGLYSTSRNDLTWLRPVLEASRLPVSKLPPLVHSHQAVGRVLPRVARELKLPQDTVVLCGGNDAVLAALSGGMREPGQMSVVHGTCDITSVCLDRPARSPHFNVRCHVVPNRWMTFFVLNTGGKAFEWFHSVFCQDMSQVRFFGEYMPAVLSDFLDSPDADALETQLPTYEPFLQGSRYSLENLTASFGNMTTQTTREALLLSLVRGNLRYSGDHLKEVAGFISKSRKVATTGGLARVPGFLRARKRWAGDLDYQFEDQSSLRGAAMLAKMWIEGGG